LPAQRARPAEELERPPQRGLRGGGEAEHEPGRLRGQGVLVDTAFPTLLGTVPALSSFGQDANGELYAVSLDGGLYALR
jgi:hypothetical protein